LAVVPSESGPEAVIYEHDTTLYRRILLSPVKLSRAAACLA